MKKDDYGFYGKGIDGYVHCKQAFDEMHKSPASHSSHRINSRHSYTSGGSWDTPFTIIGSGLALILYFPYLVYCA